MIVMTITILNGTISGILRTLATGKRAGGRAIGRNPHVLELYTRAAIPAIGKFDGSL